MGLTPKLVKKEPDFLLKECSRCHKKLGPDGFAPTKSFFFSDGVVPICNGCIEEILEENEWNWEIVDKFCQMADIPFIPKEWENLRKMSGPGVFSKYAEVFMGSDYESIDWGDYYRAYLDLNEQGQLESELPLLDEEKRKELQLRWGHNYDDEALNYLDSLYNGLLSTQNVNGALQTKQAEQICKISYEIDQRIAAGEDFDKLIASYDKFVKVAEFTPKNVKNLNDFDTCGELIKWLEKSGWKNSYYDNVSRDIVDETIKNIQAFNQRLYTNESGIGDEISHRIENLKNIKELENYYDTNLNFNKDEYENSGYEELFKESEEDIFSPE